jgi:hypothetical protein
MPKALVSYLKPPGDGADPALPGPSNIWMSREIAVVLRRLGFEVDAIAWNDRSFVPADRYDVILDIHDNLARLAAHQPPSCRLLLHLTGSFWLYQNDAERARAAEFRQKTGVAYEPKRVVPHLQGALHSLEIAHACSLIGNDWTLSTFPEEYRNKITPVPATGSLLTRRRTAEAFAPRRRQFVWFSGHGAVHKGLDLLLDVFGRRDDLFLHIMGHVEHEQDFVTAYSGILSRPNIRLHGFVDPHAERFCESLADVFAFVAPSCAEGSSTSAITCMQFGLLPILTRQNGITLPPTQGIEIEALTARQVELALDQALALDDETLRLRVAACQEHALQAYSREAFHHAVRHWLEAALG